HSSLRRRTHHGGWGTKLTYERAIKSRHAVETPAKSDVNHRSASSRRTSNRVATPEQSLTRNVSGEANFARLEQPVQLAYREAECGGGAGGRQAGIGEMQIDVALDRRESRRKLRIPRLRGALVGDAARQRHEAAEIAQDGFAKF